MKLCSKYILPFIIILLLLNNYECSKKKELRNIQNDNKYYNCCNMGIAPNESQFVASLLKYLFVGYYKGGEFGEFAMDLEYFESGTSEKIVTCVTFYTGIFLSGGRERIGRFYDTITDYLSISHLLDSI